MPVVYLYLAKVEIEIKEHDHFVSFLFTWLSQEASDHGCARKWPLVICFPCPLLLYLMMAQPRLSSPNFLSSGFPLSVLVSFFLQDNIDAISPMKFSLIPPSLNLCSAKY